MEAKVSHPHQCERESGLWDRKLPNSLDAVTVLGTQPELLFSGDKLLQPSDAVPKGVCSTFCPEIDQGMGLS